MDLASCMRSLLTSCQVMSGRVFFPCQFLYQIWVYATEASLFRLFGLLCLMFCLLSAAENSDSSASLNAAAAHKPLGHIQGVSSLCCSSRVLAQAVLAVQLPYANERGCALGLSVECLGLLFSTSGSQGHRKK